MAFRGVDHNIATYGSIFACAHIIFVAIVIAFVISKKKNDKKQIHIISGASAPSTPSHNEMGAFAFPIDKTQDFARVWTPRRRVFAAM